MEVLIIITNTAVGSLGKTQQIIGMVQRILRIIFSNKLPKIMAFTGFFKYGNLTPYGDIKNDDFTKPNSDYIIMTSRL